MSIIRKDKSSLIWGFEPTYGSFPQVWSRLGFMDTAMLPDPAYTWTPQYSFLGSRRINMMRGKATYRGSIPEIRLQSPALIQSILFPQNVNTNIYDASPLGSFSLASYIYDTDNVVQLGRLWTGGRVSRATINAREGQEVRLSLDDIAFNRMYAYTNEEILLNTNLTGHYALFDNTAIDPGPVALDRMLFDQSIMDFSGLQLGHVREFSLEINNNCQEWYGINAGSNARDPIRILSGLIQYKLTLGMDLVDPADLELYHFLLNEGAFGVGFAPTGATFTAVFGAGSDYTFTLVCSAQPQVGVPGAVIEKIDFPMNISDGGYYPLTIYFDVDRVTYQ